MERLLLITNARRPYYPRMRITALGAVVALSTASFGAQLREFRQNVGPPPSGSFLGSEQVSGQPASPSQTPPSTEQEPDKPKEVTQTPALRIEYAWEDSIANDRRGELRDIFDIALAVVKSFPPQGDHLFAWKGDRAPLNGKRFQFNFTNSDDTEWRKLLAKAPGGFSPTADAVTIAFRDDRGVTQIVTALFIDKLFYDDAGKERPDGLARCLVAVAHEVYGNVQAALQLDPEKSEPVTPKRRTLSEVAAFTASVDFLERLKAPETWGKLPEKIRVDLTTALERERTALKDWQSTKNKNVEEAKPKR